MQTYLPVHANHRPAMGAGSARGFKCQEIFHAFPDHVQVFDSACPVFCPVPFVELLQPATRKFCASIAEPGRGILHFNTVPEGTFPYVMARRLHQMPATRACILFPQISDTGCTIQPAGCNQRRVKCLQDMVGHLIPVYFIASMTTKGMLSLRWPSLSAVSFSRLSTSSNIFSAFSGGTNPIQDSRKASRMK